jgi:hypothetical protein
MGRRGVPRGVLPMIVEVCADNDEVSALRSALFLNTQFTPQKNYWLKPLRPGVHETNPRR